MFIFPSESGGSGKAMQGLQGSGSPRSLPLTPPPPPRSLPPATVSAGSVRSRPPVSWSAWWLVAVCGSRTGSRRSLGIALPPSCAEPNPGLRSSIWKPYYGSLMRHWSQIGFSRHAHFRLCRFPICETYFPTKVD